MVVEEEVAMEVEADMEEAVKREGRWWRSWWKRKWW